MRYALKRTIFGLLFAAVAVQGRADTFKAVTTFTVIADMARHVAGDAAIVESITKPGAEIHGYQPTPRDIIRAHDADLILWNGLNLPLDGIWKPNRWRGWYIRWMWIRYGMLMWCNLINAKLVWGHLWGFH